MIEHTGIALIESNWERDSNISVRGLLELAANIRFGNPNSFHYEMANSEVALKEAIPRVARNRRYRYLYLAMHGDEKGLAPFNNDRLTRTELRNLLCAIKDEDQATIRGVFLGCCLFGTDRLAEYLFSYDIAPSWIAGYSTSSAWIEASALDLLFFNELICEMTAPETEIQKINRVAERLLEIAPGLVAELGFGIFTRKQGGGVKNLLSSAYQNQQDDV